MTMRPADTLHGQLQRGLGRAARRAADVPGSAELVYDCVRHDPRWDRQAESRGLYYARLVLGLELSVGPIAEHLLHPDDVDCDEWRVGLAMDVLADLVRLSRREAAGPLRRYAEEGTHWFDALHVLTELGDPALVTGLDEVAASRCDDDDLYWLVSDPGNPVIRHWAARQPRIAEAVARRRTEPLRHRRCGVPDRSDSPDTELLALARRREDEAVTAILELGRRRTPALLDLAEEFLPERPSRWSGVVCRALRDYGSEAVPRARAWVTARNGCEEAGIRILSKYGTPQDIPVLMDRLEHDLGAGDWRTAVGPVEGLGRLRAGAAVPLLKSCWTETGYAYLRPRLLTALLRTAPHTAEAYATEGLWDCEEDVRRIAAATAPIDARTTVRLRRLRACTAEEQAVKTAAEQRLGG